MTPKEKHRTELDDMILKRKQMIMEQAIVEFTKNGIENTTMSDVAKASEVGIASLYRYFNSKTELVIQTAVLFWKMAEESIIPSFLTRQYQTMSGIRQLETICRKFMNGFNDYREFLIFLNDFEAFIRKQKLTPSDLGDYQTEVMKMMPYVTAALDKGLEDQTIHLRYSVVETYFTLSQLLLSFVQKLAVYGDILSEENDFDTAKILETAVNMILDWLRTEPAEPAEHKI